VSTKLNIKKIEINFFREILYFYIFISDLRLVVWRS